MQDYHFGCKDVIFECEERFYREIDNISKTRSFISEKSNLKIE